MSAKCFAGRVRSAGKRASTSTVVSSPTTDASWPGGTLPTGPVPCRTWSRRQAGSAAAPRSVSRPGPATPGPRYVDIAADGAAEHALTRSVQDSATLLDAFAADRSANADAQRRGNRLHDADLRLDGAAVVGGRDHHLRYAIPPPPWHTGKSADRIPWRRWRGSACRPGSQPRQVRAAPDRGRGTCQGGSAAGV